MVTPDNRFMLDPYQQWLAAEGMPVLRGLSVDLARAPVGPWPRFGVPGAVVNVDGRGDFLDLWLLEVPGDTVTDPVRHLFEAIVYVVDGIGSTTLTVGDQTRTFEWGPRSVFAIPMNAEYRHANASRTPARLAATTFCPIATKIYRDQGFLFGSPHVFEGRVGPASSYSGDGVAISATWSGRERNFWETNLVPDTGTFQHLKPLEERGRGSKNTKFLLADGILHAHLSQIPVGNYKKAHRHMGGTHVHTVTGTGYSLLWYEGDTEFQRVDWTPGTLFAPPDRMYHQHFNVGDEPARYFAVKFGNSRYPTLSRMASQWQASYADWRQNKDQIDTPEENPAIRALFEAERHRQPTA